MTRSMRGQIHRCYRPNLTSVNFCTICEEIGNEPLDFKKVRISYELSRNGAALEFDSSNALYTWESGASCWNGIFSEGRSTIGL